MKFNLSDFLQLDTKGLLAVNGGSPCGGATTGPSNNASDPTSSSYGDSNGGGSSGDNTSQPVRTVKRPSGTWDYYGKDYGIWTDNYGEKHPFGPIDCTKTNNNKAANNSSSSSGGGSCSTASSSPDSSSGKSNNPDGQGPSTTSSNPSHGGGTCPGKDGGTHIPPSDDGSDTGTGGTDIPNGGGICGGTETPDDGETGGEITNPDDTIDKTSGSFGQITDGSYADKLTMQYYKKNKEKYGVFTDFFDDSMNGKEELFSKEGCLMTDVAKVASEVSGKEIKLTEINEKCDINKDGLLEYDEISKGLQDILGEGFEVKTDYWEKQLTKEKFAECAKNGEYVLARALIDDVNENGIRDDYHWVLLEGYTTDDKGRLYFEYDGTSDNDNGRHYVFGAEDLTNNEYSVDKIITIHISK
ncbi:MAG: hypothetical protein K6F15_02840 [Treponema sp.]|nr:hypothetical protein [Treponema sp.]